MSENHAFIEFAVQSNVLRFGSFKTKAGRMSPYFFNAGLFDTGAMLDKLGGFYARALLAAQKKAVFPLTCSLDRPTRAFRWWLRWP